MTGNGEPMTPLERANAALIHYPRLEELYQEIERRRRLSKLAGEPRCMAIEGDPGTGKTTLVRTYAERFPASETEQGRCIPIFYMEMPSPATIRDAASNALHRMGDPAYNKGTAGSLSMRLTNLIQDCGVELVILDDFHHLVDSETNRIVAKVSDWLKSLIKKTGKPFLVVGIKGKVKMILKANPELSRLFGPREVLEPFLWDEARPEKAQEFARFVDYVEQAMEKQLSAEITRTEMLYRVHYATDGVVGNLMNLLRCATSLAEERGREVIDLAILSLAFRQELAEHLAHKVDPFSQPTDSGFSPVTPPQEMSTRKAKRHNKRGGNRRKRGPSLAATLSTR
jgi:Cdc6-like AAA superfamily ATPase